MGRVDVHVGLGGAQTNITAAGGGSGVGYVSLDQVVYNLGPQTTPSLGAGWTNALGDLAPASFALDRTTVYLSGAINHTAFPKGQPIFYLPAGSRPGGREVFLAIAYGNAVSRIDVGPQGNVTFISSSGTAGWVSLSSVRFRVASAPFSNFYAMKNYWVRYSTTYPGAGANVTSDGVVVLRGLVKGGKAAEIGILSASYRPAYRRIFQVACATGACCVDVLPTGSVQLIGKTYGTTTGAAAWPSWVSLSGILFDKTPDSTGY
jgi:hypothetical protein